MHLLWCLVELFPKSCSRQKMGEEKKKPAPQKWFGVGGTWKVWRCQPPLGSGQCPTCCVLSASLLVHYRVSRTALPGVPAAVLQEGPHTEALCQGPHQGPLASSILQPSQRCSYTHVRGGGERCVHACAHVCRYTTAHTTVRTHCNPQHLSKCKKAPAYTPHAGP